MTSSKKTSRAAGTPLSRTQISAAVIASLVSAGALAQQAGITLSTSAYTVSGHETIRAQQNNTGAIGATAVDNETGHESFGDSIGSSISISKNSIPAAARANEFDQQIHLSLADGVGVAGGAAQYNTGTITTLAAGNVVGASFTTLSASSAEVLGNSITATTTVNTAVQTLQGALPVGFASEASSNASAIYDTSAANYASTSGALALHTFQRARAVAGTSAAADATSTDNQIGLQVIAFDAATTSSSPRLVDNTISASLTNNTATHLIDVQTGGAPTFVGSAVIANDQATSSTAGTTSRASNALVSDATVQATVASMSDVNTLTGTLSVAGNSISSSAASNETVGATPGVAGNRILLGDGVSFEGTGSGGATASVRYGTGGAPALGYQAVGALAISNHQESWTPLSSTTENVGIGAVAQSLVGGAVALADNTVSSRAIGNANTSEIAAAGSASFSGSVALQSSQQNLNLPSSALNERAVVRAVLEGADILTATGLEGGVTHNSAVGVSGNRSSATAYGNEDGQTVALGANTIDLVGSGLSMLTAGTVGGVNASASGAVAVSSLQLNQQSATSAVATELRTGLYADSRGDEVTQAAGYNTILGSTLDVIQNTQQAVAVGNNAGNSVSLKATALNGGSVGIANAQFQTGSASASLLDAAIGLQAGTHVSGSELTASDNLQRAVAYGSLGNNSIAIDANALSLDASPAAVASTVSTAAAANGRVFDAVTQPAVSAVYGVLNDQTLSGALSGVNAAAQSSGVALAIEGNLTASTAVSKDNVVLGAAYGNDAVNRVDLVVGSSLSVAADGYVPVANVTNAQAIGGAATAVNASAGGGETVSTAIERRVVDSTVAASSNAVEAVAYGSRSVNSVSASGNEIVVQSPLATVGRAAVSAVPGQYVTDAAFSVLNAQSGQGSVTASLANAAGAPTDSASVRVQVGREANSGGVLQATLIDNATVRAESNSLLAQATSNAATNTVATQANTLATTGALLNAQTTSANVLAVVGAAGTPATPGAPAIPGASFPVTLIGAGISGVYDGDTDTWILGAGGTYTIAASGLSGAQVLALQAAGYGLVGGNYVLNVTAGTPISNAMYLALSSGSQSYVRSYTTAGTPAVPATAGTANAGGVTLAVTGGASVGIQNASLSVADNSTSGLVTGNTATNTVTAGGNAVSSGAGGSTAAATVDGAGATASADHVLSNVQSVSSTSLRSTVHGAFAIDVSTDADVPVTIAGSTLAVDRNSQTARAVSNTAVNTLAIHANQLAATSALLSAQGNSAGVAASSNLELFAPAAVSQSTVSLSSNRNVALGVANDVSSSLTVDGGASVSSQGSGIATAFGAGGISSANADHVLANQQISTGAGVSSSASTALYNQDGLLAVTPGLSASSLTISGNSTIAEASANRATNTLNMVNAANLGASTAMQNDQSNASLVSAVATSSMGVALNGPIAAGSYAASGSSVALNGNSTSALARGNTATNVLNAAPGANYANVSSGATLNGGLATAPAVILNTQNNTGDVAANGTLVNYRVSLNGGNDTVTSGAAFGSTVGVNGNSVAAQSYGNTATNTLTLSALNTGVAAAGVSNNQNNTGAISASVSSATVGTQLAGLGLNGAGLNASTVRVTGNQLMATAVGNSSVSSIAAR